MILSAALQMDIAKENFEPAFNGINLIDPTEDPKSRTVRVCNLPLITTPSHLVTFFKEAGRVVDYHMTHDMTSGILDSTCYVEFESERQVQEALKKTNETLLDQVVTVESPSDGFISLREVVDGPAALYIEPFNNIKPSKLRMRVESELSRYGNLEEVTVKPVRRYHSEGFKVVLATFARRSSALAAMDHNWKSKTTVILAPA